MIWNAVIRCCITIKPHAPLPKSSHVPKHPKKTPKPTILQRQCRSCRINLRNNTIHNRIGRMLQHHHHRKPHIIIACHVFVDEVVLNSVGWMFDGLPLHPRQAWPVGWVRRPISSKVGEGASLGEGSRGQPGGQRVKARFRGCCCDCSCGRGCRCVPTC